MESQNITEKVSGFYPISYHLNSKFFTFVQTIELMRQFLTVTCIFFIISSCSQRSKGDRTLDDLIPTNSAIILKTSSLETLESDVKNNGFLNILSNGKLLESFKT